MTSSVAAEATGEGVIAVQARKFLEIIRAVSADTIELKLEDEKRLSIVAGASRFESNAWAVSAVGSSPEDSVAPSQSIT